MPLLKRCIFILIISASLFSAADRSLYAAKREINIEGLKIFKAEELKKILNLDVYGNNDLSSSDITARITDFYRKNGYSIVKVYLIEETPDRLILYVNEGRIAKIIIHGLNNYYSLKVKQSIDFPGRIYNTEIAEQNRLRIINRHDYTGTRVELKKIAEFQDSLFQIDRELKRITILKNNLRIFDEYPAEYDVHFYPEQLSADKGFRITKNGFSFNIDYNYPSEIVPEISYYKNDFIMEKDYFEINFSAGFDPGLKGFVSLPPSNSLNIPPVLTFQLIEGEYKFHPFYNDFFGPLIRSRFYHSESSRSDFGITKYDYYLGRITLAPEFTLLNNLKIYAGAGLETAYFYDIEMDESIDTENDTTSKLNRYPFIESRMKFDPIPIRLGNRIDKYMIFTLTDYYNNGGSTELQLSGAYDFEFSDLSIYSVKYTGNMNFFNTPFYHNSAVNNSSFKGLSGEGFHSDKQFSISNEYRVSAYQDYIYVGAFVDQVVFEPAGYQESGMKYSFAIGPTGRFLFYDQFEFVIYYSIDRLYPDNTTGSNLQFKFRKKW